MDVIEGMRMRLGISFVNVSLCHGLVLGADIRWMALAIVVELYLYRSGAKMSRQKGKTVICKESNET